MTNISPVSIQTYIYVLLWYRWSIIVVHYCWRCSEKYKHSGRMVWYIGKPVLVFFMSFIRRSRIYCRVLVIWCFSMWVFGVGPSEWDMPFLKINNARGIGNVRWRQMNTATCWKCRNCWNYCDLGHGSYYRHSTGISLSAALTSGMLRGRNDSIKPRAPVKEQQLCCTIRR